MRIRWVDQYKGFLGVLVVLGHTLVWSKLTTDYMLFDFVNFLIASFHMPAFFVLSGFTGPRGKYDHFNKNLLLYFVKRAANLLVPTLIFTCIDAMTLMFGAAFTARASIFKVISNYWFVYVMLATVCFYPILKILFKKDMIIVAVVCLLTIIVGLFNNTVAKAFGYMLCYCCGVAASELRENRKFLAVAKKLKSLSIPCIVLGAFIILAAYFTLGADLMLNVYYKTFMGLFLSFALIPIFSSLEKSDVLVELGLVTLQMYLMQFAFLAWISYHIPSGMLWVSLISFVFMTGVAIYLPVICHKLWGKSTVYNLIFNPYPYMKRYLPRVLTE